MTTIRQIITDAFRISGITAVGSSPEADEYDEAFRRLNVLVTSLIHSELGDRLLNLNYGDYQLTNSFAKNIDEASTLSSLYIPANTRLMFNNNQAVSLFLPPNPEEGARIAVIDVANTFGTYNVTLNGNGRNIEDTASIVLATNGLNRTWLYRGDLGNWTRVTDIDNDASSPFPQEFDSLLIHLLAIELNPSYGAETRPELIAQIDKTRGQFKARYRQTQEMPSEEALGRMHPYYTVNGWAYSTERFNQGRF